MILNDLFRHDDNAHGLHALYLVLRKFPTRSRP